MEGWRGGAAVRLSGGRRGDDDEDETWREGRKKRGEAAVAAEGGVCPSVSQSAMAQATYECTAAAVVGWLLLACPLTSSRLLGTVASSLQRLFAIFLLHQSIGHLLHTSPIHFHALHSRLNVKDCPE
uniref:Uncharacterized protein n=1 Tax=Plectus sambesii TaxID=2011161 RepID=A0A914WUZ5_9BILA